ncbi:MAG: hypothetical protein H7336_03985 [Bacteriovorax sp.]|nr:hypothetical protein [Bacteriovorax sp.]
MFKTLVTLALLTSSVVSYAQMSKAEKESAQSRLEGTLPTPGAVEDKSAYRIHMGLTAGVSNPNGDAKSSPEYGLNVGFQPYVPFGLGSEITTTELDNTTIQRTNLLVRGTYNFGGDIPVLKSSYVGLVTGPMFQSQNEGTEWSVGPVVGFDIPLQEKRSDFLSLGLSAKYLYTTNVQDAFSAGLALKYWY